MVKVLGEDFVVRVDHELCVKFDHIKNLLGFTNLKCFYQKGISLLLIDNISMAQISVVSIKHSLYIIARLHLLHHPLKVTLAKNYCSIWSNP